MGQDPAGTGYGAGSPQAPGGAVPHGIGGAAPGAWGGGGARYGPGDGCGILGVGYCPPIPGAQGPEDMVPMDLTDQPQMNQWVHHMVVEALERAYLV